MVTCCAEIFIVLAAVVVIYIATRSVGVLLRDLVFLRRHGVKSGGFRSSWILGVTYSTIQIYRWEQCLAKGHGIAWPSWLTACVRAASLFASHPRKGYCSFVRPSLLIGSWMGWYTCGAKNFRDNNASTLLWPSGPRLVRWDK